MPQGQQHVQRRIGQQHAQPVQARGKGLGQGTVRPAPEQHDRAAGGAQLLLLLRADLADDADAGKVPRHQGKGLFIPKLARPQKRHAFRVPGIAGEVEAAQTLDRRDSAFGDKIRKAFERIARAFAVRFQPAHAGAADRAGIGLGVMAPVLRVAVLGRAFRAHRKPGHGGMRAVVGNARDDGKARPAVRAVDEGIAVPPVLRVQQLRLAVRAQAQIRRDRGPGGSRVGGQDRKPIAAKRWRLRRIQGEEHRAGRAVGANARDQGMAGIGPALAVDFDPIRGIANKARQAERLGLTGDKGAKADALYNAVNGNEQPNHPSRYSSSVCVPSSATVSRAESGPSARLEKNMRMSGLMSRACAAIFFGSTPT